MFALHFLLPCSLALAYCAIHLVERHNLPRFENFGVLLKRSLVYLYLIATLLYLAATAYCALPKKYFPLRWAQYAVRAALDTLRALPAYKQQSRALLGLDCAICQSALQEGDSAEILTCHANHIYHSACISEWKRFQLEQQHAVTCPTCRLEISGER